jgi:hypothetical protein
MKKHWGVGIVVLCTVGLGAASPASAQGPLDRLESGIRNSNGQTVTAVAAPQRVYLGAFADNEAGRGVRVLSVRSGGPAERAGLQTQDLVIGAAGRKIQLLEELSTILNALNPGDHLSLDLLRGNKTLRIDVVLGAPPGATQPGQPGTPPSVHGAGKTEALPPPPGEAPPALPPEGPAIAVPTPQPIIPNSPQAQIEELRRRVDQLERRVQELEHVLAAQRK